MTNGDRIRNMTDEEIADVVMLRDCKNDKAECQMWSAETSSCITMCRAAFIEWLKQEVMLNGNAGRNDEAESDS